jgi:hypothetical protein
VLKRARPSNCWERQDPETGNMGYAGSCEVVCPWLYVSRVLTLPLRRDAWAKHKDLESYEAKWLYVDALLKVSSLRNLGFRQG